jgi:hypothetical protein
LILGGQRRVLAAGHRPGNCFKLPGCRAARPADLGEHAVVIAGHVAYERTVEDDPCGGHLPGRGAIWQCVPGGAERS